MSPARDLVDHASSPRRILRSYSSCSSLCYSSLCCSSLSYSRSVWGGLHYLVSAHPHQNHTKNSGDAHPINNNAIMSSSSIWEPRIELHTPLISRNHALYNDAAIPKRQTAKKLNLLPSTVRNILNQKQRNFEESITLLLLLVHPISILLKRSSVWSSHGWRHTSMQGKPYSEEPCSGGPWKTDAYYNWPMINISSTARVECYYYWGNQNFY